MPWSHSRHVSPCPSSSCTAIDQGYRPSPQLCFFPLSQPLLQLPLGVSWLKCSRTNHTPSPLSSLHTYSGALASLSLPVFSPCISIDLRFTPCHHARSSSRFSCLLGLLDRVASVFRNWAKSPSISSQKHGRLARSLVAHPKRARFCTYSASSWVSFSGVSA